MTWFSGSRRRESPAPIQGVAGGAPQQRTPCRFGAQALGDPVGRAFLAEQAFVQAFRLWPRFLFLALGVQPPTESFGLPPADAAIARARGQCGAVRAERERKDVVGMPQEPHQ